MEAVQVIATAAAVLAQIVPLQNDPYYEPVNIRPDLGMKVTPKLDRFKPFRFTAGGKLQTNGVDEAIACRGTVRVRIRKSNPTVAKGTTRIQPDCTWSSPLRLNLNRLGPKAKRGGTVRITARFGGNEYLQADAASQRKAAYGRSAE